MGLQLRIFPQCLLLRPFRSLDVAAGQQKFKIRIFLLLDRHPFWANELYLPKYPENIQLASTPQYGDTPSPSSGDLCICTPDDIVELLTFQGSGAFILPIRSNTISFANWMYRRNQGQEKSERAREVEVRLNEPA